MSEFRIWRSLCYLEGMPRKPLIESTELPYHITNRSNRKEFFDIPLDTLWPIFVESLNYIVREMNIRIYSFVLMNNHYHMLISTPELGLSNAMNYFQREVAKRSNRLSRKQISRGGTILPGRTLSGRT